MEKATIVVENKIGLHARPAASFAQMAGKFKSSITIAKMPNQENKKNGKSLVGIMSLCVKQKEEIIIEAIGEDEKEAVTKLKVFVENGCGE